MSMLLSVVFLYLCIALLLLFYFFFFNDTATTEIYTLSLHDALPIYGVARGAIFHAQVRLRCAEVPGRLRPQVPPWPDADRKSTRLNSSHLVISYAVFCLKKKKKKQINLQRSIN